MPRKMRCFSLVLILTLMVSLAGQVAQAMPSASRTAIDITATGNFFASVWTWLAEKLTGFGHLSAAPAHRGPTARPTDTCAGDPNGHPCV
jgi:hypothetical protein